MAITEDDVQNATVLSRFFYDPGMLSDDVRDVLLINDEGALPVQFNGKRHPFTTKIASGEGGISPVDRFPWRAVGKLFMKFDGSTFACTGSVINSSLVVTAAHCVHNFGEKEDGFADAVSFEPARHGAERPFGTWVAKEWWIPRAHFDGTDNCSPVAPKIVCENDIAVVVLEKRDGSFVAEHTGRFGFQTDEYGYSFFLNKMATQVTQLGYPGKGYDGFIMIRTDSLGYQANHNNVVIGSAQTDGSDGAPFVLNFGINTSYGGLMDDDDNQVVGTTSWAFIEDVFAVVQGASRFGRNGIYTDDSNIQSLVNSACTANPAYC